MKKVKNAKALKKAKEARETKKALMLNPRQSFLTASQLLHIVQRTPKKYIYRRPAKGGGEWEYVPGAYIKKVLNYVFNWNWDFKVLERPTIQEILQLIDKGINQIWVYGELTVKDKKGMTITKGQTGRADIKFYKNKTKGPLDIGNDMKSANTDCLKKCASEFGIASDVYGRKEFKDLHFSAPKEDREIKTEDIVEAKIIEKKKTISKKDLVTLAMDKIKKEKDDNVLYKMLLKIRDDKKLFSQTARDELCKMIKDKIE